jgi:TldD protein
MVQAPYSAITATDLATLAIELIARAGCEYGDVRFCNYRSQNLYARDRSLSQLSDNVSSGFGVRVLLNGAWGFAASPHKTPAEVERIVALAVDIAKGSRLSLLLKLTPSRYPLPRKQTCCCVLMSSC